MAITLKSKLQLGATTIGFLDFCYPESEFSLQRSTVQVQWDTTVCTMWTEIYSLGAAGLAPAPVLCFE